MQFMSELPILRKSQESIEEDGRIRARMTRPIITGKLSRKRERDIAWLYSPPREDGIDSFEARAVALLVRITA
jgi:hypothetical protein